MTTSATTDSIPSCPSRCASYPDHGILPLLCRRGRIHMAVRKASFTTTSSYNKSIHPAVGYFSSPTYTHGRATSPSSRRCKKPPSQLPSSNSSPPPPLQRQPSFHGISTISFRRRPHLSNGFHNQSSHRPNRNNLHRTNTPGPR